MKKTIFLLLFFTSAVTFAQHIRIFDMSALKKTIPVDTLLFTVQYETTMMKDTEKPDKLTKETMMLRVGKTLSEYYSYTSFLTDSVLRADIDAGASQQTINEHLNQYGMGQVSYKIYKNYPTGRLTMLDRIAVDNFRVEEAMPKINWTITVDTATVCGYLCKKATAHLYGRDYEAWFTPEIPRNDGPWKLQGLPGLILKANDTQNHYTFLATGIEQASRLSLIEFSTNSNRLISRKELNMLYKRFNDDPQAYIQATAPNVTVTVRDEAGNVIKKMKNPHNPIELK